MKKSLLLLASLLAVGSAVADNALNAKLASADLLAGRQIATLPALTKAPAQQSDLTPVTPEGTPFDCYVSFYQQGYADYAFYDMPIQASMAPDGSAIYFSNLFPKFVTEETYWIKGDIQADGTILIAQQFVMDYLGVYNLYAGGFEMETLEMHDITFVINDDGSISQANPDELFMLAALDENGGFQAAAMYQNNTCIYSEPKAGLDLVTVPEGVEIEDFIYSYTDLYNNPKTIKGQVAVDGDNVYFRGFTPEVPDAWIMGTKEGDEVTILPGQYLGMAGGFQLVLSFLEVVPDFSSFWNVDQLVLIYDAEQNTYTQQLSPDGNLYFFAEALTTGTLYAYNFNFSLSYYPGIVAAKPAAPYNVKLYDFSESAGRNCVYFDNTGLGVNGEYLEPENLYYQIFMDDELYTLTTDNYTNITEDITLIPWAMADGKDIYANPASHFVYVYDLLFETMGAQIVYFVDGEAYYSDIVSADWDGNQYVTEVNNNTTGIQTVASTASTLQYFDLAGRRLLKPEAGINVVRIQQADGSFQSRKTLVK